MIIKPFLSPERIIVGLDADDRHGILQELMVPLVAGGIVADATRFLEDLERREAEVTTVMDNGVAIPHARSHAVKRLGLCVGLSPQRECHLNPDSEVGSQLFFCIAIPSFAPTCHMPLLQVLATFSRDPRRVAKLLSSKTPAVAARYLGSFKG